MYAQYICISSELRSYHRSNIDLLLLATVADIADVSLYTRSSSEPISPSDTGVPPLLRVYGDPDHRFPLFR